MKKNKKAGAGRIAAEVGAGAVAAAALAMAGGYMLWERMGKQQQAKVKTWVAQARKEAAKNIANAKKMSQAEYKRIVDESVKRYGSLADVNKAEMVKTAAAMKAEWKRIQAHAKMMGKEMSSSKTKLQPKKRKAAPARKTKKK